jgi:hypothetical protein
MRGPNRDHLGELGLLDTPEAAARLAFPQLDPDNRQPHRDQKDPSDAEDARCAGAQDEMNQSTGCGVYFALDPGGRPVSCCDSVCASVLRGPRQGNVGRVCCLTCFKFA